MPNRFGTRGRRLENAKRAQDRQQQLAAGNDRGGRHAAAREAEWPLTLKGLTVNCAGHTEDAANKVLWVSGDNAFCILADGAGLTPDDINSLTNAIQ